MAAPFDYSEVSSRAECLAVELHKTELYSGDTWHDPTLGPLVRVYALLTHRPHDAFDQPVSAEHLAECRTYAYVYFAAIYDALAGAATVDDGYFDLLSEYDSVVDANLESAMNAATSDARARMEELEKARARKQATKPGTIKRRGKGRARGE